MNEVLWLLTGGLVMSLIWLFLFWKDRLRRKRRLDALRNYLESAVVGQGTALIREEDEFSILEDEIYKTVSELQIAKEQAVRERQYQADNLADIAHQLKTPLTSMSLMTQLLEESDEADRREYIHRIESQLSRLEWLTSSLLTMSRLDAGSIEFASIDINFEQLALCALESLEQVLRERHQRVIVHGGDVALNCDIHWMTEVLVNIIKNCSEHTLEDGEITLEASTTPLYIQISVEDNGSGFEPEDIPKLFRRFYRGKNAGKDSIGIGLALSRGIVEGQGGILRAENCMQGGARFVIRFYS